LETELFKLPSTGGSKEQKRKKTILERDLEDVDARIDEIKNKLRKYDALNLR
jgi:hypothetical protein